MKHGQWSCAEKRTEVLRSCIFYCSSPSQLFVLQAAGVVHEDETTVYEKGRSRSATCVVAGIGRSTNNLHLEEHNTSIRSVSIHLQT